MKLHHLLLILHLICATIWVGGHLILSIRFLPKALKKKDPNIIIDFEKEYGAIGMPALVILIITGIWMAYDFGVPIKEWFSFSSNIEKVVSTKLTLLFITFAFALNAQLNVIPELNKKNMKLMAFHIISVTIIGIIMLILGSTVRYGGL